MMKNTSAGSIILPTLNAARGVDMSEKPHVTVPGKVEKIIQSPDPKEPEKAQINIEKADPLYQEVRIENTLTDKEGKEVKLKKGAKVDVTIEATDSGVVPKPPTE
jgi:hypothetical protein